MGHSKCWNIIGFLKNCSITLCDKASSLVYLYIYIYIVNNAIYQVTFVFDPQDNAPYIYYINELLLQFIVFAGHI